MNIKIHNHYIVLLIRTLLWEAGDSDKFVGADLSTETNWKHQTVKLPVQSVESQVCKKQPCEYYVYTKALQKHWWPGNWLLCQSSWRNHSKLNIAKGHFYLSKFFRSKQKLQQSLNSWSNWPRPVEFLTSCHPTPSLPPKKIHWPKKDGKNGKNNRDAKNRDRGDHDRAIFSPNFIFFVKFLVSIFCTKNIQKCYGAWRTWRGR